MIIAGEYYCWWLFQVNSNNVDACMHECTCRRWAWQKCRQISNIVLFYIAGEYHYWWILRVNIVGKYCRWIVAMLMHAGEPGRNAGNYRMCRWWCWFKNEWFVHLMRFLHHTTYKCWCERAMNFQLKCRRIEMIACATQMHWLCPPEKEGLGCRASWTAKRGHQRPFP